jgi:hypothetical protein
MKNMEIALKYLPIKNSEKVFVNGLLYTKPGDYKIKDDLIKLKNSISISIVNVFYNYEEN